MESLGGNIWLATFHDMEDNVDYDMDYDVDCDVGDQMTLLTSMANMGWRRQHLTSDYVDDSDTDNQIYDIVCWPQVSTFGGGGYVRWRLLITWMMMWKMREW